jgi:hypothetical protein
MAGYVQNQIKTVLNDARLATTPFSVGVDMGLVTTAYSGPWDQTAGNAPLSDEAAWSGYSRQPVSGWSASVLTADNHAQSQASVVSFGNSSGSTQTAAGWFLLDTASMEVIMLGQFPAPIPIADSEVLPIAPFWRETNE